MKILLIVIFPIFNCLAFAEDANQEKLATTKATVYKYKEYETIDLGSMEIKGQIIAPGDLSVNERERKIFIRSLLEKSNFDSENKREIENLR